MYMFQFPQTFSGRFHIHDINGFVARREPLVEQELINLPEHPIAPPVFSEVRVTRSLVLCVCFVDRCLSFCIFFLCQCIIYSSLIYQYWLPHLFLQPLLHS